MKTKKSVVAFVLIVVSAFSMIPQTASAQGVSVSFQVFYDELSPYGTWVNNNDYGYVWVPDVAPGFTPYGSNGYWVFTEEGWTWVSDYPWGWAPFHYGRWFYDASYGPMWVPDNQWGPGWVTWRRSAGYYGWAPIAPGISISIAYGNGYNPPYNQWRFVRENDFGRTNINNYYVNTTNNVTIINNSTVINNKSGNGSYNAGPGRVEVEKTSGRAVTQIAIKENSKPGQQYNKGELEIYRPRVENTRLGATKPIPAKVSNLKDVKPASQKSADKPLQIENQQAQPRRDAKPAEQKELSREGQPLKHQQQADPSKQEQPKQHTQPKATDRPQPKQEEQPAKQEQALPPKQAQPERQGEAKPAAQPAVKHPSKSRPQNKQMPQPKQDNPSPKKK